MARLSRYTQKIFGSSAAADEMAEYGSFAAGTPNTYSGSTITPTIIQTLSSFLDGWFSAVVGVTSPAIEDMNSLFYLAFFQLCYLFQQGISEWDSGTTYYTGSLVQSSGVQYVSIQDNNTNHAVSNVSWWASPTFNGLVSANNLGSFTVATGNSMFVPYLTIPNAATGTVSTGAQLVSVSSITLVGTALLQVTGTGIVQLL